MKNCERQLEMIEPEIRSEIVTHAADHEIFLSFNGDRDVIQFNVWWHNAGKEVFMKWAETHDEDGEEIGVELP